VRKIFDDLIDYLRITELSRPNVNDWIALMRLERVTAILGECDVLILRGAVGERVDGNYTIVLAREVAAGVVYVDNCRAAEYECFVVWRKERNGLVLESKTISCRGVTPVLISGYVRCWIVYDLLALASLLYYTCERERQTLIVDVVNTVSIDEEAIGIVLSSQLVTRNDYANSLDTYHEAFRRREVHLRPQSTTVVASHGRSRWDYR
jgi:hypothetical protein